jgi:hypothetical protein
MKADEFEIRPCPHGESRGEHLFVRPDFVQWQAEHQGKALRSFGVYRKANDRLHARLTVSGKNGAWASPVTGAFGGVHIYEAVPVALLEKLVAEVSNHLSQEGNAASMALRFPPACFPDSGSALLQNVVFRQNWTLLHVDVNYHIPVEHPDTFTANLGATKRQEIRRQKAQGSEFAQLPLSEARAAYEVISRNRAARGYPMTMSWDAMRAVSEAFPAEFQFFGVRRHDTLRAAAICIMVRPEYMYVFYWGEEPEFRREMPVLLLAQGLVARCFNSGVGVLDIGISTDASTPNEGLMEFKAGLGCLATPKPTYRRTFDRMNSRA